jgi:hypothetical protein
MSHAATLDPAQIQNNETHSGSQTWIHILGAFAIGSILAIGLVIAPTFGRSLHQRQIAMVQQAVLTDLHLILDKEREFYAKNGFYTTDLKSLGISAKKVLYKFGFVAPSEVIAERPELNPEIKDLDALKAALPDMPMDFSPLTRLNAIKFDRLTSYCMDCTATLTRFKAIAAANLDDDPVLDVWTIDEQGAISHVINDLK